MEDPREPGADLRPPDESEKFLSGGESPHDLHTVSTDDSLLPGNHGRGHGDTGHRADEVIAMMMLWRTLARLYKEQANAWERLCRVGLPEPAQAREAASFRRWERELSAK